MKLANAVIYQIFAFMLTEQHQCSEAHRGAKTEHSMNCAEFLHPFSLPTSHPPSLCIFPLFFHCEQLTAVSLKSLHVS